MKKSDLKQNMVVETRNGERFIVFENVLNLEHHNPNQMLFISSDGYQSSDGYDENLISEFGDDFDVIKIMEWKNFIGLRHLPKASKEEFNLLWEREPAIQWEPWELEVLMHIPQDFNKIARNYQDGEIYIIGDKTNDVYTLRLNLPSLQPTKASEINWLNIDEELARYRMKRGLHDSKIGEKKNEL